MRQDTFAILPNLHVMWVIILFAAAFLAWGAVIAWRWAVLRRDAADIFTAKKEQGELAPHVAPDDFIAAYIRSEAPRGATYFYLAALGSAILVPPGMALFSRVWGEAWALLGAWPPTAPGTMVHTFSSFLAMMAIMIAIAAFAMRRYHADPPQNLRRAIQALNDRAPDTANAPGPTSTPAPQGATP